MAFVPALLTIASTAVSAVGTIAGANAQSAALNHQAKIERQKGMQEQAAAQRQSLESTRKGKLALSKLQANASASGAGADDPTVANLAGDIGGRSAYQSSLNLWQGQMQKWDADVKADAKEMQADATQQAGKLSAFSTILGGVGSLASKYGASFGTPSSGTLPSSESLFSPTPTATETDDEDLFMGRSYWFAN